MSDEDENSNNKNKTKIKVEYLDDPVKSKSDKKKYKVLRLENGFTALLISDFYSFHRRRHGTKENKTDDNANNESRVFQNLEDSEMNEKMAACGLCINVGSFSDPSDVQGLAHYLEHVIPLASEKYPQECEYERFVRSRGGFVHADTGNERTRYLFQIHPDFLLPAMDRFAHFFIKPLLDKDMVLRERESVDNEFYLESACDYDRIKGFFNVLASYGHPSGKFSCGNSITLRDKVKEKILFEKLGDFKEKHYSAHRMTLVVQATLALDTLEDYVTSCFANLTTNSVPPDDFSKFTGPSAFEYMKMRKFYHIKPINDICEMEIKWITPPTRHFYRSKPFNYISRLINREDKGSLSYHLRKKQLCTRLSTSFEQYSIYSTFSVKLTLTNEGRSQVKDIVDVVFSYVNMVKRNGPHKKVFDELQNIADNKFRFADQLDPFTNVQNLCYDMHLYPPSEYLTGNNLFFDFDEKAIQTGLDYLNTDNMIILVMDKNFNEDDLTELEPWYKVKFLSIEIPNLTLVTWKTMEPLKEFSFPNENSFVATDYELEYLITDGSDCPVKIRSDPRLEIWYRPDMKYLLPKCCAFIHLINDVTINSIQSGVMLRLFELLIHELVLEELYDAKLAGFYYKISETEEGILIKAYGFTQTLPLVLKTLISYVTKFPSLITEELFNPVKSELLKYYSNVSNDPGMLASEIMSSTLKSNFWTSPKKMLSLKEVIFVKFVEFSKQLTRFVHVECLVQGNVYDDDALHILAEALSPLKLCSLSRRAVPSSTSYLPLGQSCFKKINNMNPLDVNSVVMNYYQTDNGLAKQSMPVLKEFIEMIMRGPLFLHLRSTEQLGYCVTSSSHQNGFSITVCSPAHKLTTEHINERIDNFLIDFIQFLKTMSMHGLSMAKHCFKKLKNCDSVNLLSDTEKRWFAMKSKTSFFDEHKKEILTIDRLTIDEMVAFIANLSKDGKSFKKLSIQIEGNVSN